MKIPTLEEIHMQQAHEVYRNGGSPLSEVLDFINFKSRLIERFGHLACGTLPRLRARPGIGLSLYYPHPGETACGFKH